MAYGDDNKPSMMQESLESWVVYKCDQWRDHFESNYSEKFDEYYRLWRGIWAKEDVTRDSERSKIISLHCNRQLKALLLKSKKLLLAGESF